MEELKKTTKIITQDSRSWAKVSMRGLQNTEEKCHRFDSTFGIVHTYCDEPLLRNGRLSTDVIAMATNTENQPITRNG
jgi:hypothetical protein